MAKESKINTALPTDTEEVLTSMEVAPAEIKAKNVEVNISKEFRVFLGDRYWSFKVGKTTVPEHVKEYLRSVNALSAI